MFSQGSIIKLIGCGGLVAVAFLAPWATSVQATRAALEDQLAVDAGGAGQPLQGTAEPQPTPTPASGQQPVPIQPIWTLHLRAFPDTVGMRQYACQGCNGVFESGDKAAAAGLPLQPLTVAITEPGNPRNVYWIGQLGRGEDSPGQQDLTQEIPLKDVPPPYQVNLITVNPLGYTVCPNSRPVFIITQADFDALANNRTGQAGDGRGPLRHEWFFWSCRPMRP